MKKIHLNFVPNRNYYIKMNFATLICFKIAVAILVCMSITFFCSLSCGTLSTNLERPFSTRRERSSTAAPKISFSTSTPELRLKEFNSSTAA